ncbi:hypothetical protein WMY93_027089 [Mugilogobius chulae]|uniref:Uncharacterized protein n=1 Tax=Mugilogobius chulae TaxID=88201 RepID=A0AAW0MTQ3_9GOBI
MALGLFLRKEWPYTQDLKQRLKTMYEQALNRSWKGDVRSLQKPVASEEEQGEKGPSDEDVTVTPNKLQEELNLYRGLPSALSSVNPVEEHSAITLQFGKRYLCVQASSTPSELETA